MAGTSPAMTLLESQDETHRAERAELVGVDEHTALLDAEAVADPAQDVAVAADIFADALVAAEAVADEIGAHRNKIALDRSDADVRDHPPCARFREFGVAVGVVDADHALADALAVVGH